MRRTTVVFVAAAVAAPVLGGPVEIRTDEHGRRAVAVVDYRAEPPGTSTGAVPSWVNLGPFGGDVEDINASPTAAGVVLAGLAPDGSTGGTLYRSIDGGLTWTEVGDLSGVSVFDIEFTTGGTCYIGTIDGVWKSTDDGVSWTQLNLNIGLNDQTFDVEIDPSNDMTIWAGIADALGGQLNNIMRSTDGGATWVNRTPAGAAGTSCRSLAVHAGDPNKVAAAFGGAFGGGSVWVTANAGSTWSNRTGSLPANPMKNIDFSGDALYVGGGQAFGSQNVGLWMSTDDGVSWTELSDASWPNKYSHDFAIDPGDGTHMLACTTNGMVASSDGGASWTVLPETSGMSLNAVRFTTQGAFVGASSIAVLRSTDNGASFVVSSEGIGALDVQSVGSNPLDPDELALSFQGLNNGGIYSSTDGGATWSLEPVPGTRWNDVVFKANGTLYALNDGPSSIAPEGVYRREIDGTWTGLGPDQGSYFETELYAIEFGVNNPDLILAGGSDFGYAGFKATIWRSPDDGVTWDKVYLGPDDSEDVQDILFVTDGAELTAVACYTNYGTPQEGGALKTTDGGLTWGESSTGLDAETEGQDLSRSPDDVRTFLLADSDYGTGNGGLWKSTDAGDTWSRLGPVEQAQAVIVDPGDAQTVYRLRTSGDIVSRSTDGGATFDPFNDGISSPGAIHDLSYSADRKLYMASGTGAWMTSLVDCPPDLNGDGLVNSQDFIIFLNAFVAGDPLADWNGDGVVNSQDFIAFLNDFVQGC